MLNVKFKISNGRWKVWKHGWANCFGTKNVWNFIIEGHSQDKAIKHKICQNKIGGSYLYSPKSIEPFCHLQNGKNSSSNCIFSVGYFENVAKNGQFADGYDILSRIKASS